MNSVIILSFIFSLVGGLLFGIDAFFIAGISSFFAGTIIIFYRSRCGNCGKWFSYKKIEENYSDYINSNILSDDVYVTQYITFQCTNCKKKIKKSKKVIKKIKGNSDYKIDKLFNNKNKY